MREYAKRKKIKIELKSNENLNIINSEGFVDGAQG